MKRIGTTILAVAALAFCLTAVAQAQTPNPNGTRLYAQWINCPVSTITLTNTYPGLVSVTDNDPYSFAGSNKHLWKFSEDGGATNAVFTDNSNYSFCADVVVSGNDPDDLEGGLEISPWWSEGDGQFMVNGNSGEIAVFGGRLPFCSNHASGSVAFTQPDYVKGTTIHMSMTYISGPNGPSQTAPATVTYSTINTGITYTFGPTAFDQGNTAEDPPHGLWGELTPASVGGYAQCSHMSTQPTTMTVSFSNICYSNLQSTPTHNVTWGKLKAMYH
jgi:hypothetical protein